LAKEGGGGQENPGKTWQMEMSSCWLRKLTVLRTARDTKMPCPIRESDLAQPKEMKEELYD
jgi:hypothetical protein